MTTLPRTTLPRLNHATPYQIDFRAITEDDMAFLSKLYRSTREAELAEVTWSEAEKQVFCDMQFEAQHKHYQQYYPDAQWLVIKRHGTPIGRLYLERWPREHRIIDIALSPAVRGQGIGGALLQDLQESAIADEARGIGVHVEKANPAMSLYRRLGFTTIEEKGIYDLLFWTPPSPAAAQNQVKTASY